MNRTKDMIEHVQKYAPQLAEFSKNYSHVAGKLDKLRSSKQGTILIQQMYEISFELDKACAEMLKEF